jgi:hypothetical protein
MEIEIKEEIKQELPESKMEIEIKEEIKQELPESKMKIKIKEEMKQELPESGNMQTPEIKIEETSVEDCEEVLISQRRATTR